MKSMKSMKFMKSMTDKYNAFIAFMERAIEQEDSNEYIINRDSWHYKYLLKNDVNVVGNDIGVYAYYLALVWKLFQRSIIFPICWFIVFWIVILPWIAIFGERSEELQHSMDSGGAWVFLVLGL